MPDIIGSLSEWFDENESNPTGMGRKVLMFILDLVASADRLPPKDLSVLSVLGREIRQTLAIFCAANEETLDLYPDMREALVKPKLEEKSLPDIVLTAIGMGIDVSRCDSKRDLIQELYKSRKDISTCILGDSQEKPRQRQSAKDKRMSRMALMILFYETNGESWRNKHGWGSKEPLNTWHGITVESDGRVIKLALQDNNLRGESPSNNVGPGYPATWSTLTPLRIKYR